MDPTFMTVGNMSEEKVTFIAARRSLIFTGRPRMRREIIGSLTRVIALYSTSSSGTSGFLAPIKLGATPARTC